MGQNEIGDLPSDPNRFDEHGDFEVNVHGRIVETILIGQVNRACASTYALTFTRKATSVVGESWATLTDLRDWELSIPDAYTVLTGLSHWCVSNNQKISAIVLNAEIEDVQKYQLKDYFYRTSKLIDQQYFTDKEEAIAWLASKGFKWVE